jgi:DNA (cytosine-5)-methyltransferase 1
LLSLFCGPGGLDEGFKQAGFSTELAFDLDQECVNTFNKNHASARQVAFVLDLATISYKSLNSYDFRPIGIIGGPPCQSFSVSNVHQSDDDPRHALPATYAKLLSSLNKHSPISFFLFENVTGLLSGRHQDRYALLKRKFRIAGFDLHETVLDAQDFGVPQRRKRLFIVGINRATLLADFLNQYLAIGAFVDVDRASIRIIGRWFRGPQSSA